MFLVYLIDVCILDTEGDCLGVAAKEHVYMAICSSAVLYGVDLTVDHQFGSERYAAHGDCSAGGRCGSACG